MTGGAPTDVRPPRARVIKSSEFRRMRWKNGGGETIEIAISPQHATVDNFDWRISMAQVESDGSFSTFGGVDRSLAILRGSGIALTIESRSAIETTRLSPPLSFDASAATWARLLDGPVVDLNVMTRRGRYSHRMRRIASQEQAVIETSARQKHLLAWDGAITIETRDGPFSLESGDVLCAYEVCPPWRLSLGSASVGYLVEIFDAGGQSQVRSAETED